MTGFHIDRTALCDATGLCLGLMAGSLAGAVTCIIATLFWGY
jgi:hypothetical protein